MKSLKETRKSKYEREMLDAFLATRKWGITDIRKGIPGKEPDFILTQKGKTIGVELTEIFCDTDRSAKESLMKRNVSNAHQGILQLADIYYAMYDIPIRVIALDPLPKEIDRCKLAAQLFNRVRNAPEMVLKKHEIKSIGSASRVVLYVRRLPVKFQKYKRWDCASNHIGWPRLITSKMMQVPIRRKASRLGSYSGGENPIILIVYANKWVKSGYLYVNKHTSLKADSRGFKEIYFYLHPEGIVKRVEKTGRGGGVGLGG